MTAANLILALIVLAFCVSSALVFIGARRGWFDGEDW